MGVPFNSLNFPKRGETKDGSIIIDVSDIDKRVTLNESLTNLLVDSLKGGVVIYDPASIRYNKNDETCTMLCYSPLKVHMIDYGETGLTLFVSCDFAEPKALMDPAGLKDGTIVYLFPSDLGRQLETRANPSEE